MQVPENERDCFNIENPLSCDIGVLISFLTTYFQFYTDMNQIFQLFFVKPWEMSDHDHCSFSSC